MRSPSIRAIAGPPAIRKIAVRADRLARLARLLDEGRPIPPTIVDDAMRLLSAAFDSWKEEVLL